MSTMRGPGAIAARGTSHIDQLRGTVDFCGAFCNTAKGGKA
jgi:hypothetical protein